VKNTNVIPRLVTSSKVGCLAILAVAALIAAAKDDRSTSLRSSNVKRPATAQIFPDACYFEPGFTHI
jgi:hypothetical protein